MKNDDRLIRFEELKVGMFLVAHEHIIYDPPMGLVVIEIQPTGFYGMDDRCHNRWWFGEEDISKFHFYTDEAYYIDGEPHFMGEELKKGLTWDVGFVNHVLHFDVKSTQDAN